jgi:hypothetical protein
MQAAKLADQAGPVTAKAAGSARRGAMRGAGGAPSWAGPRVGRARAWMAVRAARGSVSVQETVAPKVGAMLAATARRLDPPKQRSRRWPKLLASTAILAAGGAAATAMILRTRRRGLGTMIAPKPPVMDTADQAVKVFSQNAEAERERTEAELNGLTRSR